jgi:hypothetical protein
MATKAKAKRKTASSRRKTARKTATASAASRERAVQKASARALDAMKELVYAQAGIYGEIYDELNARVSKAKTETPKHWRRLVRRGEQVQKDLEKAQSDLKVNLEKARSDLQKRLKRAQSELRDKVRKVA